MYAIEFEADITGDTFTVPADLKNQLDSFQHVKIIMLMNKENSVSVSNTAETISCLALADVHQLTACIKNAPSDLSGNPIYMQGYGE